MKLIILIPVLALGLFSCSMKSDNFYSSTDVIEIKNYTLPDTAILFDTVRITAHSEEPNGCWSDLNFVLSKTNDSTYRIKAFGSFTNNGGICPDGKVSRDTVFEFIPVLKGRCYFYITQPTFATIDTLFVK
jgi:hypothetical protein